MYLGRSRWIVPGQPVVQGLRGAPPGVIWDKMVARQAASLLNRRSKVTQRRLPLFTIIAQGRLLGDDIFKIGTQRAIDQHETTLIIVTL
jgi:hypothetical protein